MFLDKLPTHANPSSGDDAWYRWEDLMAVPGIQVVPLDEHEGGWLLVHDRDGWIDFALVEFAMSDDSGSERSVSLVWSGSGPGDGLRELRHSYFGDKSQPGYVFYLSMDRMEAAFKHLRRYFDGR